MFNQERKIKEIGDSSGITKQDIDAITKQGAELVKSELGARSFLFDKITDNSTFFDRWEYQCTV